VDVRNRDSCPFLFPQAARSRCSRGRVRLDGAVPEGDAPVDDRTAAEGWISARPVLRPDPAPRTLRDVLRWGDERQEDARRETGRLGPRAERDPFDRDRGGRAAEEKRGSRGERKHERLSAHANKLAHLVYGSGSSE
jgi:hypothetical protein